MTDSAMDVDPCCFACCGFDTALLLAIPAYSFIIIIIYVIIIIIIIIIIKGIYTAQVRNGHKCAMSAVMAVGLWLRNCLCLYSYLHN